MAKNWLEIHTPNNFSLLWSWRRVQNGSVYKSDRIDNGPCSRAQLGHVIIWPCRRWRVKFSICLLLSPLVIVGPFWNCLHWYGKGRLLSISEICWHQCVYTLYVDGRLLFSLFRSCRLNWWFFLNFLYFQMFAAVALHQTRNTIKLSLRLRARNRETIWFPKK